MPVGIAFRHWTGTILTVLRKPPWLQPTSRLLILRLSAMGDVINTLPALDAIRRGFPKAFIGWIVEDRFAELLRNHPSIDRVHVAPRRMWQREWWTALPRIAAFVREVRRERYELVLDFQSNLRSSTYGLLSGVRRRAGFARGHCREESYLLRNVHIVPPAARTNRVLKNLSVAAYLGAPIEGAGYRLPASPESEARVREFLARQGLARFAVVHPGVSEYGKIKRWSPERYSALADRLRERLDVPAVVTWGPGERELAEQVATGHGVLSMETRSLLDLAELIRRAALFVGCDSGPLHLASAVGTPCVGLFGPKDPVLYRPYNPRHRIVFKPGPDGEVMDAITVDDAFAAVADLMRESVTVWERKEGYPGSPGIPSDPSPPRNRDSR